MAPQSVFLWEAHEDRVVDWDNVMAVPYVFSGISLEETLFWNHEIQLDSSLITVFQNELTQLEIDNRNTTSWSNMLAENSRWNAFLYSIITRYDITSQPFTDFYPELIRVVTSLRQTPEIISLAIEEWNYFINDRYLSKGIEIPDWPRFIEIQEYLGTYGRSTLERKLRKVRRRVIRVASLSWGRIPGEVRAARYWRGRHPFRFVDGIRRVWQGDAQRFEDV